MQERGKIKTAAMHCHTYNSTRDSAQSPEALVKACVELGATAVVKTDHRTLAGEAEFIKACKKYNVKPILGVEADVEDNDEGRKHLILMEKDEIGHVAVNKAVTESNTRTVVIGKLLFPRMSKKILNKYFGPEAKAHGHVIATSACIIGVLAGFYSYNEKVEKQLSKLTAKQEKIDKPNEENIAENQERLNVCMEKIRELRGKIVEAKKISMKSTVALEKRLEKAVDEEKRRILNSQIESVKRQAEKAEKELVTMQAELGQLSQDAKLIRMAVSRAQADAEKYYSIQKQIDEIKAGQIPETEIDAIVEKEALYYENLFGKGNFYIELQYHGMKKEKEVMPKLAALAKKLGIPTVIANDAHMPDNSDQSIMARAIMRATMFDTWDDPTASDKELYVKTDEELIEKISEIIPHDDVMAAYENVAKIVAECNVEIPKGSHYPEFHAPDGMTPGEYLRKLTYDGVPSHYGELDDVKRERIEYELKTIHDMGFDSYFCIVEDFLSYAREAGKLYLDDPNEQKLALTFDTARIKEYVKGRPGETVGPGRGSAAGSIVCYLTGITNIDPIEFGLLFERFLNPERVSMPDIDCDIETNVRAYVIEYVKHKYGAESVSGIMTSNYLTGKAAIQTARSVYSIKTHADSMYYAQIGALISKKAEEINTGKELVLANIADQLRKEFKGNKPAEMIIEYALMIEGVVDHFGQHAAGVIIADGKPVDEYVALMYSKQSELMLTQCDKIEAEEAGMLKMDFLGLRNLTIITDTLRMIQKTKGKVIRMEDIPYEKTVFDSIFSEGLTNSVFQFESPGMKKMLRSFKPESIFDITLLVAMFRPGPLQFLQDVIDVKNGKTQVKYLTKELEPILKDTYGSITYQEQVQQIFRELAGYSYGQADLVRRAMSKKKEAALKAERSAFIYGDESRGIHGCEKAGISISAAEKLFDQMTKFSEYAFNKSHAACYAVVAYQTAWLKYHYPVEYMAAVMNKTVFDKYPDLMAELAQRKIKLLQPDVNMSGLHFMPEDNAIRYGLSEIKGIGEASVRKIIEERANGAYTSIGDLMERTAIDKKAFDALTSAGAFDSFCNNRNAVKNAQGSYRKWIKVLNDASKKWNTEPDPEKKEKLMAKMENARSEIRYIALNDEVCENGQERLEEEKEVLGGYVSGHPLDLFESGSERNLTAIADIQEMDAQSYVKIRGIITEAEEKVTRKTNEKFCMLKVMDKTGTIDVVFFSGAYRKVDTELLQEGKVVVISGKVLADNNDPTVVKISGDRVETVTKIEDCIVFRVSCMGDWMMRCRKKILPYTDKNGFQLYVYDELLDRARKMRFRVSPKILEDFPELKGEIHVGKYHTGHDNK